MKTYYRLLTGVALLLLASSVVWSQQQPEPAHKLIEFHMALLKHGPKWNAAQTPETKRIQQAHVNYVLTALASGKAVIAGPFTDGGEIDGVYVFRASSAAEAKAWAEGDPSVDHRLRKRKRGPKVIRQWPRDFGSRKCIRGGRRTSFVNLRSR